MRVSILYRSSVTNMYHIPCAFPKKPSRAEQQTKNAKRCSRPNFYKPYSPPGLNPQPGIRPTASDINVDQLPLIQRDANPRSHPLRYNAARLLSWSITIDTQDYHSAIRPSIDNIILLFQYISLLPIQAGFQMLVKPALTCPCVENTLVTARYSTY